MLYFELEWTSSYCLPFVPDDRYQWNLGLYDGTLNSNERVQVAIFVSFVSWTRLSFGVGSSAFQLPSVVCTVCSFSMECRLVDGTLNSNGRVQVAIVLAFVLIMVPVYIHIIFLFADDVY